MSNINRRSATRTGTRMALLAAAITAPIAVTSLAQADVTCGDKICGKGYICNSYESYAACPAIARLDGQPIDCATTSTTVYQCDLAPCSSDADCGDGMLCYSATSTECSGGASPACDPAASDCATTKVAATPSTCTTTTTQQCTPRYLLPCKTAGDCGPGFNCEEEIYGFCSGSAGAGTATAPSGTAAGSGTVGAGSGGATGVAAPSNDTTTADIAPPDIAGECSQMPSGNFSCVLQVIACQADSDCPTGMTCVDNAPQSCWASSDGTSGCDPVDPAKICQPPDYANFSSQDAKGESLATGTGDASGRDGAVPAVDSEVPASENSANSTGSNVTGGGCSISTQRKQDATPWLAVLVTVGLGLGLRRRRSQK